jgi:hypothetical protein
MVIAKDIRPSESNHWYTRDGVPQYTVPSKKDGSPRSTNLRDARELNLVPSVTTILGVAAKPALTLWLQKQVLLSALTLPKKDNEKEDDYIARIIQDSKEEGKRAADAGTDIHGAIQSFYEGGHSQQHSHTVEKVHDALQTHFNRREWKCEHSFAHELGFGGKCDLYTPAGIVIDIKTKEFTDPSKVEAYDEHLMQLAAYRVGLGIPDARAANLFVSRNVPGLVKIVEWDQSDLNRGWEMFLSLLKFWQLKNKHA